MNVLKLLALIIIFQSSEKLIAQPLLEINSNKKAIAATNVVDFSPNGKMIATYTKVKNIALWKTDTGELIKQWPGQAGYISELDWSPDGLYLASASTKGNIVIWNINSTKKVVTLGQLSSGNVDAPYAGVNEVEFSPDGQYVAAMRYAPKGEIVVWQLSDFKEVFRLKRPLKINDIGWSADSNAIYTIDQLGTLRKWSFPLKNKLLEIKLEEERLVDISGAKQGIIASGGSGDKVVVYDIKTNAIIHRLEQGEFVNRTAVAIDINRIASAGGSGNLFIWDLKTGELIFKRKAHEDINYYVTFSPDNKYLATSGSDNYLRIWNAKTGELTLEIFDN